MESCDLTAPPLKSLVSLMSAALIYFDKLQMLESINMSPHQFDGGMIRSLDYGCQKQKGTFY